MLFQMSEVPDNVPRLITFASPGVIRALDEFGQQYNRLFGFERPHFYVSKGGRGKNVNK